MLTKLIHQLGFLYGVPVLPGTVMVLLPSSIAQICPWDGPHRHTVPRAGKTGFQGQILLGNAGKRDERHKSRRTRRRVR